MMTLQPNNLMHVTARRSCAATFACKSIGEGSWAPKGVETRDFVGNPRGTYQ